MKRKPTPAQIAARERFAEMARSGAFKKAAKAKAKPKQSSDKNLMISQAILERVQSGQSVKSAYDAVLGKGAYERLAGELYNEIRKTKSNPAKKTVSQKISQLSREGYPQKQAVAIALSEERAGKVKRNPMRVSGAFVPRYEGAQFEVGSYYETRFPGDANLKVGATIISRTDKTVKVKGTDSMMKSSYRVSEDERGNEGFYPYGRSSLSPYIQATDLARRSNPRASNPIVLVTDSKPSKRKANPLRGAAIGRYACIMPEPSGMAYGIDERTPVTIRFSASELKRAYKCYLIPANVRESAGYKRLIAQQKEVYMSLAELKQLFRSFI